MQGSLPAAPQPRGARLQYKWIVTLVVIFGAFIRMRKHIPPVSKQVEQGAESEAELLEAMIPG